MSTWCFFEMQQSYLTIAALRLLRWSIDYEVPTQPFEKRVAHFLCSLCEEILSRHYSLQKILSADFSISKNIKVPFCILFKILHFTFCQLKRISHSDELSCFYILLKCFRYFSLHLICAGLKNPPMHSLSLVPSSSYLLPAAQRSICHLWAIFFLQGCI